MLRRPEMLGPSGCRSPMCWLGCTPVRNPVRICCRFHRYKRSTIANNAPRTPQLMVVAALGSLGVKATAVDHLPLAGPGGFGAYAGLPKFLIISDFLGASSCSCDAEPPLVLPRRREHRQACTPPLSVLRGTLASGLRGCSYWTLGDTRSCRGGVA